MKLNDRLKIPQERIDEIFEKLAKLPKPKAPLLKEVFESKRKQIMTAVVQGHSLRAIAMFLSNAGIRVSHVTLRKIMGEWQEVDAESLNDGARKSGQNHGSATAVNKPIELQTGLKTVNNLLTSRHAAPISGTEQGATKLAEDPKIVGGSVNSLLIGSLKDASGTKKTATKKEKFEKAKFDVEPDKEAY